MVFVEGTHTMQSRSSRICKCVLNAVSDENVQDDLRARETNESLSFGIGYGVI